MMRPGVRGSAATVWRAILTAALMARASGAQAASDKEKAVFEGSVRDSITKAKIAKAAVQIIPAATGQPGYAATSDANGAFRFESIVPGDYRFQIRARGYAEGHVVGVEGERGALSVHFIRGQTVGGAVIDLDPEAVITGRITDADGEPASGAVVFAVVEQWQRGFRTYRAVASAQAKDRGEYRLKIVSGRYYLSAHGVFDEVVPRVYTEGRGKPEMSLGNVVYPNSPVVDGGTPFDLRPGQQITGIDFKLTASETVHVRGTVRLDAVPSNSTFVTLRRRNGDRSPGSFHGASVSRDATFDLSGVLPGAYWLEIMPLRNSPTGRLQLDVADRDLNGVRLPSIPQFDIKGRVRMQDDDAEQLFATARLHIDWLDWFQFPFASVAAPDADGAFTFSLKPAGEYIISLAPDRDLYIQSVVYNQHSAEGARIDFTNGLAGDVEVVLGTGTGEVKGKVQWPEAIPGVAPPPLPPGATAVLVWADGVTGNTGARSASIDLSGSFQFHFVPPGRYFAFISPRFDEGLWQNIEFVRAISGRGASIEVRAKGEASVEAPILVYGDIERARARVPR